MQGNIAFLPISLAFGVMALRTFTMPRYSWLTRVLASILTVESALIGLGWLLLASYPGLAILLALAVLFLAVFVRDSRRHRGSDE